MPAITSPDINDFLDECGWARTTLTSANSNLARWERWCAGRQLEVLDATHRDLRAYLAEREAAGIGGSTRHKDWQHVRAFYRWAATPVDADDGGAGLLTADPMTRCRPPEQSEPVVRTATVDLAGTLEGYYSTLSRRFKRDSPWAVQALRDAALVSLLMRSGVRSCEAGGIDLAGLVRDGDGRIVGCEVPAAFAKKNEKRLVPLTDETPRLVERYLRRRGPGAGPLFLARPSKLGMEARRMSPRAVQGVVRRAATACGVEASAHDFRRGWAVNAAARGIDRGWIKLAGGWTRDKTLDRYLGESKGRLAVEQFHAAAGERTLRVVRVTG